MAYLRNGAVNLLSISYGLYALAANGAGAFFAVFLLKQGLPLPGVFGAIALIVLGRFLIRPSILVLAPRFGLRPLLIFGTVFSGVQYLFIARVQSLDVMLLAFCLTAAIGEAFYWTTFHAYFAYMGDPEHRGHQISAREAFASASAIIGPLIGGWALTHLGPHLAFGAATVVHAVAAVPLIFAPVVRVPREVEGGFRAATQGVLMFAADGWTAVGYSFAWQIALFVSLGQSFSAYGGVLASAAVVGAIGGLILGRHIDGGHGEKAVWVTFACLTAVVLLRAGATQNAALAVIANALGALVLSFYIPTMMTAVYNQEKSSPCALRFHTAAEGGWDAGCAAGCMTAALLSYAGAPLPSVILLSLAGAAVLQFLLRRHYAAEVVTV